MALRQKASEVRVTYDEWLRVPSPWRVVEAAAADELAQQAAVTRIIDTMLELQLVCRHKNPGYQPFSVTGNAPMPRSGRNVDQAMIAAEHYSPESEWHRACRWLLDQIPPRQAAAMLLQAARVRPDKMGESQWMVTARQLVERQAVLLRSLGIADGVRLFESVEALEVAARRARKRLREWLAGGEVSPILDPLSG